MSKVYRLLRNNQQTGPYSLEEIVLKKLKPFDLIWVEGRSCGWCYPSELDALKPYIEITTTNQKNESLYPAQTSISQLANTSVNKMVFVSMPANIKATLYEKKEYPINEKKAEEPRPVYITEQPVNNYIPHTKYSRSLEDVEESYTSWMFQKKRKHNIHISKPQLTAIATTILLLIGGLWAAKTYFGNEPRETLVNLAIPQPIIRNYKNDSIVLTAIKQNNLPEEDEADLKISDNKPDIKTTGRTAISDPIMNTKEIIIDEQPDISKNKTIESQVELPDNDEDQKENNEPIGETSKQKKRSIKETVNGLFKKLTKKDNPIPDDPKTEKKSTETSNGERIATRRNDEGIISENLADEVDIKMNKNNEWMMGVQGLKLTLYNRSNVTIKSAAVEVLYFNEHKSVIEKKLIYFFDIPAKKSQTVAAPDQRLADYAEYKIISVKGVDDAFARH